MATLPSKSTTACLRGIAQKQELFGAMHVQSVKV
jgi:hypothetical protein